MSTDASASINTPASIRTVRALAAALGAELVGGDPSRAIAGIASLVDATPSDLAFMNNAKYLEQFHATRAGAVIVDAAVREGLQAPTGAAILFVQNVDLALNKALSLVEPPISRPPRGVDGMARIAPDASIHETCAIGPFVSVGRRSTIGQHVVIHAGVFIGDDVHIGEGTELFPNVVVRDRITIGRRVVIHACSALGTDGFGYTWDKQKKCHAKVPQIGTVVIEDDVEIGSCSCVDRAKFNVTRIGRGSKLDNHVQVGHNAIVGEDCIIAGQTGLSGSVQLGAGAVLGGKVGIVDHLILGAGSQVGAGSMVFKDVEPNTVVSGIPARPHRRQLREAALIQRLPEMVQEIRELQEQLRELKAASANSANEARAQS